MISCIILGMIILEFEKQIFELESKIRELQHLNSPDLNVSDEVRRLKQKLHQSLLDVYERLTPWQEVQIARHPERPQSTDYIKALITDFTPLAGDRNFAEDTAIIAGIGRFRSRSIAIIAHNKGKDTDERIRNHFGMPMPEGYRKAARIMDLANKFSLPILTLIDTAGAFPGIQAEERGQSQAIAACIEKGFSINVPIISVIIGEGGSGGAIAIGVADVVLMLEHAVYSVISPEGCASILWKSADKAEAAASALKLTSHDLLRLNVIDKILPEPVGAAHRDPEEMIETLGKELDRQFSKIGNITKPLQHRKDKFLNIGRIKC